MALEQLEFSLDEINYTFHPHMSSTEKIEFQIKVFEVISRKREENELNKLNKLNEPNEPLYTIRLIKWAVKCVHS